MEAKKILNFSSSINQIFGAVYFSYQQDFFFSSFTPKKKNLSLEKNKQKRRQSKGEKILLSTNFCMFPSILALRITSLYYRVSIEFLSVRTSILHKRGKGVHIYIRKTNILNVSWDLNVGNFIPWPCSKCPNYEEFLLGDIYQTMLYVPFVSWSISMLYCHLDHFLFYLRWKRHFMSPRYQHISSLHRWCSKKDHWRGFLNENARPEVSSLVSHTQ